MLIDFVPFSKFAEYLLQCYIYIYDSDEILSKRGKENNFSKGSPSQVKITHEFQFGLQKGKKLMQSKATFKAGRVVRTLNLHFHGVSPSQEGAYFKTNLKQRTADILVSPTEVAKV